MENVRRGRPKSKEPIRNKTISIKVTPLEFQTIQQFCIDHDLRYIDILKKGLENWSDEK